MEKLALIVGAAVVLVVIPLHAAESFMEKPQTQAPAHTAVSVSPEVLP